MTDLPMTTYGGDGKAPKRYETQPMEDHNEATTEQSENPIEEFSLWLDQQIEGQFGGCELVDEDTTDLLEVFDDEEEEEE